MAGLSLDDWLKWLEIRGPEEELLSDDELRGASLVFFHRGITDREVVDKFREMKFTDFEVGYALAILRDADEKIRLGPLRNVRDGLWYAWVSLQIMVRGRLHAW